MSLIKRWPKELYILETLKQAITLLGNQERLQAAFENR